MSLEPFSPLRTLEVEQDFMSWDDYKSLCSHADQNHIHRSTFTEWPLDSRSRNACSFSPTCIVFLIDGGVSKLNANI